MTNRKVAFFLRILQVSKRYWRWVEIANEPTTDLSQWENFVCSFVSDSEQSWWPYREVGRSTKCRSTKLRNAIYICPSPNCAKSFNWKGNLNRHLRYECGVQPRFKCPYCEYRCKVKGDVSKHIPRRHHGLVVYVVDLFTASSSN